MKMKGRIGAYSFYTSTGGRQVARIANNSSNYGETAKRTPAMQTRRTRWGNVVSFFRNNKDLMARAFERKDSNLSDYNRFMQLNIPGATVALEKDAFMRGMAILQEYIIADGSLPGIDVAEVNEDGMTFNLLSSLDGNLSDYTIGAVSVDLLDHNPQLQEGDQLTFISYTNAGSTPSTIRIYRHLCEMTIDSRSAASFDSLKFADMVTGNGLKVAIAGQGDVFGQAIIHSRSVGGSLLVSRTKITLNSDTLVRQFSAPEAVQKAINSYGVDAEKLLEPGSSEQPAPSRLPDMATVSVTCIPSDAGDIEILNTETQERTYNEALVPRGSKIQLLRSVNEGYEFVTYVPEFTDNTDIAVTSDLSIQAVFRKKTPSV